MNPDWSRLSIAELLIITSCICIGYAVSRGATETQDALIGGLLLGACLAGPMVFLFQAIWRGRRTRLSDGEVLWLSPLCLFLILLASSNAISLFGIFDGPIGVWSSWFHRMRMVGYGRLCGSGWINGSRRLYGFAGGF